MTPSGSGDRPRNPDGTFAPSDPGVHPPELIEQARDYGFEEAEIQGMRSSDLRTALACQKRNRARARAEAQQKRAEQEERDRHFRPSEPRVRPSESDPKPSTQPAGPEEYDLGADAAEFDPALQALLKKHFGKLSSLNEALRQKVDSLHQRDELRTFSTNTEKIDAAFAALPENFRSLFGAMTAADMDPDKDQALMKRRVAVLAEAKINPKAVNGRIDGLVKKAAETLFGPLLQATAAKPEPKPAPKPAVSEDEWRNGALSRPTHRTGAAEPKGEELAKRNLAAKLGEDAVATETGDSEVLESLLN